MTEIARICSLAPVIPVLTVEVPAQAVPLAEALVRGGLPALEVTLRTPAALEAISAMRGVEGAVVGAGTLLTPADVADAVRAGAEFGVSPGLTRALARAAGQQGLPFLPGVATPSEAMRAGEMGFDYLKFFPAEANGGVPALKAWAAPLARFRFCPTGGVGPANAAEYLGLRNVACVGGSWVVPPDALAASDWPRIEALAREAAALARPAQSG